MKTDDFLEVAQALVASSRRKPKQAFIRRSVSTTYYALFHTLARNCADSLIGGSGPERRSDAWRQIYRSLDRSFVKNQCGHPDISRFPEEVQEFAQLFRTMQVKRHQADYDPSKTFDRSSVEIDIEQATKAINCFQLLPVGDRRAFAVFVLFKARRD